jgi:hypothetical protein
MKNYYGIYYNRQFGWAWRNAAYLNDEAAIEKMKVLSLKKEVNDTEKLVFYDLQILKNNNRTVYNG